MVELTMGTKPDSTGTAELNVLVVHNRYGSYGGEEAVVAAEVGLLTGAGHRVVLLEFDPVAFDSNPTSKAQVVAGLRAIWNETAAKRVNKAIRDSNADVVHFHNTHPVVSPAAIRAARLAGAAVVRTLHNYRLVCASGVFFRSGRICEDCAWGVGPLPAIAHSCYRGSRGASAATAASIVVQRTRRLLVDDTDLYITPTRFARRKLLETAHLPPDRVWVKPHFVDPDPGPSNEPARGFVYVGRLEEDKGIRVLIDAWNAARLGSPLLIIGEGPLEEFIKGAAETSSTIQYLGRVPQAEVADHIARANMLIAPSKLYETFGLGLVQAFSRGRSVIASDLGAAAEIVEHGRTGLLVQVGDASDLASALVWAETHPSDVASMNAAARSEFLTRYTAATNIDMLIDAYKFAMSQAARRR